MHIPESFLEIGWDDVAEVLEVSPRTARRLVKAHMAKKATKAIVRPIRYGYRTVKFNLRDVVKFKKHLRRQALKTA